ncbi:MAG: CotH kinase family protein [Ruminococcus bromii]|nr:CotH kinase family protein [Ruminococcus bromii]
MSGSKYFDKIAWTVTALILVVTVLFMNGGVLGLEVMAHTMGYENRLFDNTRVHTIDIVMNDWDEFIANATSEEYYTAAVVIDGEAYKNVGIRGKGNTSLSTVSSMNSDRYSFKVEFDHYDNSITYHGLDKLSLNNLIQDSTMMKDYLTYTMMNEFGAAAPLCSFVYLTVGGEDWGLYLAVEGVEDSFLERNYGSNYGELYKPDSMSFGGGRGNGKDFNMDDFMNNSDTSDSSDQSTTMPQMPDMGNFDPSQMPGMTQGDSESGDKSSFGGGRGSFGGMGSSDVKLRYIDDSIDSYSNIWNNAKTDITEADQMRLIESLEKLSNGEQIESVVDIEQVIRYFVVHNFVCNGDSYTGSMIHNYYLYEENGQLAMLPWDYNLAYGTFQGGNGQSTVNTPIDAPVSGGSGEDRPMWNWILSDESYTELYHQYFTEFLNTVDIVGIIDNAYNLIKSYVEKDPTAFYSYEEFETGVETMRQFCTLRSESISMQLANGETTSNMNYVDAAGLTLSDMGSMGGKGGFGGMTDRGESPKGFDPSQMQGGSTGEMPEGFDPSQMQGGSTGEMPEGFDPSQMPEGFPGQSSDGTETTPSGDSKTSNNTGPSANSNRPSGGNMQMPGGDFNSNMNGMSNTAQGSTNRIWLAVSVLILGAGLIIAKIYK